MPISSRELGPTSYTVGTGTLPEFLAWVYEQRL